MSTYFSRIVLGSLLFASSINLVVAQDARLEVSNQEYAFTELLAEGLISSEGYDQLVALGVQPSELVTVKVTKDLGAVEALIQSGEELNTLSGPHHGDAREFRWQLVESGNIYSHTRIEQYRDGGSAGWFEFFFSREFIEPAPVDNGIVSKISD